MQPAAAGTAPCHRMPLTLQPRVQQRTLAAVVEALANDAGRGTTVALKHAIEARLAGCLLNAALNPTCRTAIHECGGLRPLIALLGSSGPIVLTTAATAIAYLNDKVEHRPGALDSSVRSTDGAAGKVSYHKSRFHATGSGPPPPPDPDAPADTKRVEPDEGEEAPGTRTKATYGSLPLAKLGATHDSRSKVSMRTLTLTLTLTAPRGHVSMPSRPRPSRCAW
jgi:hypothetical protein